MGIKVKICGITNLKDARAAVRCGADLLGFIFAKSPRRITKQKAAGIIKALPKSVAKVGVFVNERPAKVKKIAWACRLDALQFHGNERPAYCERFRKDFKVIKAFRIKGEKSLKALKKYKVDTYLLDTFKKGRHGGTGKTFDWRLAKKAKRLAGTVILSGGLNSKNVKSAIRQIKPYAVDVSSGVESKPGKKDLKLIKRFIKAAKA